MAGGGRVRFGALYGLPGRNPNPYPGPKSGADAFSRTDLPDQLHHQLLRTVFAGHASGRSDTLVQVYARGKEACGRPDHGRISPAAEHNHRRVCRHSVLVAG